MLVERITEDDRGGCTSFGRSHKTDSRCERFSGAVLKASHGQLNSPASTALEAH
jgi:hypothetical protein